jgi:glucose-1-phosphate cytidylyltransferase
MIDSGIWRNIGQRLWAVREHLAGKDMFLANTVTVFPTSVWLR